MIIMPTVTPLALTDLNQNNQTQHQQIQNAEQSKKTTDTVQLSAQARALAGSGLHPNPTLVDPNALADREMAEKVADNEIVERQRPVNPLTQRPETTKIDIVA